MKLSNQIKRKGNIENWWFKYKTCYKCKHWESNFAEDDIDKYGGCTDSNKRDYEINSCHLTRDEFVKRNTKIGFIPTHIKNYYESRIHNK